MEGVEGPFCQRQPTRKVAEHFATNKDIYYNYIYIIRHKLFRSICQCIGLCWDQRHPLTLGFLGQAKEGEEEENVP